MSRFDFQLHIRRFVAGLFAVVLLLGCVPPVSADPLSGQCGDSLTWTLDGGVLTVEGSGDMWDYSEEQSAPWFDHRNSIIRLVLPEGMTSVGSMAFYKCAQLTHVVLPASVTEVGEYAFAQCHRLTLLNLGSVQTIRRFAFSECTLLAELTLPGTVRSIGDYAFSYCWSLTLLVIPESVEQLGRAAFAYCTALVRAEVRTVKASLSKWCFAGCSKLVNVLLEDELETIEPYSFQNCESLSTVFYRGDEKTRGEIEHIIRTDNPTFEFGGTVSNGSPVQSSTSGTVTESEEGDMVVESTTVVPGENASASSTVVTQRPSGSTEGGSATVDVVITVENQNGWSEAIDQTEEVLSDVNQTVASGNVVDKVTATVYVKNQDTVDQDYINQFAGRDMLVTFVTQSGSEWTIDFTSLDRKAPTDAYDLSFEVKAANQSQCDRMQVSRGYLLRFASDAEVNAAVKIRLAMDVAKKTATLFGDNEKGELVTYQSVVVDNDGYAHFYLGSVTSEADYYIGIGVDGAEDVAIIPENMHGEYAVNTVEPILYEITGRKSSWGMGIGTVTWIMGGVMLGTVVIVGVIMFTLNKRKLQAGYIPDIGEDEYDEEEE